MPGAMCRAVPKACVIARDGGSQDSTCGRRALVAHARQILREPILVRAQVALDASLRLT